MVHLHYFITRRPDLAAAEFHRYWRDVHGPIVRKIPQLRAYVQSHRVEIDGANCPYDGAAEVWLDGEATVPELMKEHGYLDGALADEPNFIDMQKVEWQLTTDRVILDGKPRAGMVKGLYRIKRKAGFTLAEFQRYWRDVHAGFGLKLPGLRRYVQCATVDSAYAAGEPAWDGIAQIWFDDGAAVRRVTASPEYAQSFEDIGKFVGTVDCLFAEEVEVIGRKGLGDKQEAAPAGGHALGPA